MKHVRMERRGATGHVVISRVDKRNALSSEVYAELGEAFAVYAGEETVRCLVLRADGPMFSAGNDVRELAGLVHSSGRAGQDRRLRGRGPGGARAADTDIHRTLITASTPARPAERAASMAWEFQP